MGGRLSNRLSSSKLRLMVVALFAVVGTILIFVTHANPVRDSFDQPYLSTSFWNTPLGTGAQYNNEDCNREFGRIGSFYPGPQLAGGGYMAVGSGTRPYYRGSATDPVYKVYQVRHPGTDYYPLSNVAFDPNYRSYVHPLMNGGIQLEVHVPADAHTAYFRQISGDTQGNENRAPLVDSSDTAPERQFKRLVQSNGTDHTIELFQGGNSSLYLEAFRVLIDRETHEIFVQHPASIQDAGGNGEAGTGTRAGHLSSLGGVVRERELFDKANIQHALVFTLPRSFSQSPHVWPNISDEPGYAGKIPFGSLLALPLSVDINDPKLGLGPEGKVIARAMQQYGGYTADSNTGSDPRYGLELYGDFTIAGDHYTKSIAAGNDWKKIVPLLKCVSNNSQARPGGPGARVTTNVAPPLAGENGVPPPPPPPDNPPTVNVTAPAAGAQLSGVASITANASDDHGVTKVEYYSGTTKLGEDTAAPYNFSWDTTTAANGSSSITAKAYDTAAQSTTSAAINVTITNTPSTDTIPPITSITAPDSGATVTGTVNISANASDNVAVTKLELYIDDSLSATDIAAPYVYSWNTTSLTNGSHSLTTKAYDAVGHVTSSAAVAVTVSNVPTGINPGDIDGNGTVDVFDLRVIGKNWGLSGRTRAQGDLNGDGTVNIFDLRLVGKNWGT